MLSPVQAVEDLNTSSQDCISFSSMLSFSSDTFADDLSYLIPGFEFEDSSSINRYFSIILNFTVVIFRKLMLINFALTLNLSRNSEDITSFTRNNRRLKTRE